MDGSTHRLQKMQKMGALCRRLGLYVYPWMSQSHTLLNVRMGEAWEPCVEAKPGLSSHVSKTPRKIEGMYLPW